MFRFIRMPLDVKQRYVRCSQDSGEGGACFVEFQREETEGMKPSTLKAVSIQALPSNKFVILALLEIYISCACLLLLLDQMSLAVLPDISSKMQTFWVSDGLHSVHTITLSDMDAAVTYDGDETQEKLIRITVIQAVLYLWVQMVF